MLSKEQKLRYGEMLRQQMKEKQDRKRQEDLMKRGGSFAPPINKVQSDKVFLVQPTYNNDPKEVLQKKLEAQDYNPFGKAGGGAPNLKGHQNITVNTEGNYSGLVMSNQQQYPQRHPHVQQQGHPQVYQQVQTQVYNGQEYNHVQPIQPQKYPPQYQPVKNESFRSPEQLQPYQRPVNDYPIRQQQYQQHSIPNYQDYPPQVEQGKRPIQYQPQSINKGYHEPVRYVQPPHYQQAPFSMPTDPRAGQGERVRTLQNEQMQQMYKRGGRNLLKLQNETVNEHLVKQKQKLQMQAFLKQQMQQAEHRKQMEKEKLKREELEEERRNRQYIEQQNQKLRDEERKKNQEKQKIIDENLRNVERRKQLQQQAKDKLQRQRLQQQENERKRIQQDRQRDRDRQRQENGKISKMSKEQDGRISREGKASREGGRSRQGTITLNSTSSENTTQGKGFNTDISRQFFRKQREKQPQKFRNDKKLQMFTNQIQKMRDEINNQGQMFQREIERIKKQSQNALIEKKKAEYEIQKLKLQLQKKNRQVQLRLMEALKRNDPYQYPKPQYHDSLSQFERAQQFRQQQNKYVPPTPPKMPKTNKVQEYEPQPLRQRPAQKSSKKTLMDQEHRRLDQSQVMTLDAQSKKIPLSIGGNSKLTMSNIQNYGKDSLYYQQSRVAPKKTYKEQTIMEEMEQSRLKSRNTRRGMDELDKFVGSRQNKRWEMSTVQDDITKQIQDLLKKKQSKPHAYNPIQQAGRHVLSRGGLPYQGNLNTLSSNKISSVSNGTFDVDKVYNRNEARLKELKALGVETVNTNNDQDLNRLNELLKNYQ